MNRWLALLLLITLPLFAQKSQPNSEGVALTIYNQDFAVVRQSVPLDL